MTLFTLLTVGAGYVGRGSAAGVAGRDSEWQDIAFSRQVVNLEDLASSLVPEPTPRVRRTPPGDGEMWYGEIYRQLPGDDPASQVHNVPFAVQFRDSIAVRVWCDANMNGDLGDDAPPALSGFPGETPARSFLSDLAWVVRRNGREVAIDRLVRVVLPKVEPDGTRPYRTQNVYGMLGTATVDGGSCRALLFDANRDGLYTKGHSDGIFFDRDGDRHFVIDVMAPDYGPFAIPFTLGRTRYTVDRVDPLGTRIALHRLGGGSEPPRPTPGAPAPEFSFTDIEGHLVRLSDLRGRAVVVYFWSSWCGGCNRHAEALRALYGTYDRSRVEFLGISYDTDRTRMEQFRHDHGQTWPTSFTGGFPAEDPVGRVFREAGSGVFYLIAPDGRLVGKFYDAAEVEAQLGGLLESPTGRTSGSQ